MCKILIMNGLDPKKKKLNWQFIMAMGEVMSEANNDGLGYAAVDKQGNVFGERWWWNYQAFAVRDRFTKPKKVEYSKYDKVKDNLKDFVSLEPVPEEEPIERYSNFGTITDEITAITLHARYATSGKEFINTHPFYDEATGTSLIHNGVIQNVSKADNIRSTCDSERILNKYLKHEVNKVPADIQNALDEVKGYFACGVFTKDANGNTVQDVFRSRANLGCALIKELGCVAFSTSLQDIVKVCNELGFTIVYKQASVKENTLVRFEPNTGKVILTKTYTDNSNPVWSSAYGNRGNSGGRYKDDSWYDEEWTKELEARRAKQAAQTATVHQFPSQSQVEEKRSELKSEAEVQATQDKAAEVIAQANAVDEIIERNSTDPMNESLAANDGWGLTEDGLIWEKKGYKH